MTAELSERQQTLLALLRDNSQTDPAGRLVSTWTQAQLAARLGLSVRTLRRVLDDLREPDLDPRHLRADRPPGRRLGLVKIEPTLIEPAGGGRLYAENLYVLTESWPVGRASKPRQPRKPRRKATATTPPTASTPDPGEGTDRPLTLWPMLDPKPEEGRAVGQ